jgi:hypothetical protein
VAGDEKFGDTEAGNTVAKWSFIVTTVGAVLFLGAVVYFIFL